VLALDSNDLSTKSTYAQRAGRLQLDTPNGSELLFIDLSARNIVGALRISDGSLTRIAVAYTPGALAVNSKTNRIYVADRVGPEMLVLDGSTHALINRVFVGTGNPRLEFYSQYADRQIAVSQALNRIYLGRTTLNSESIVDVFDGSTNQLLQSVTIGSGAIPFIAVDDTHHRWFANGTSASTPGLFIYDLDTNAFITKVALPEGCNGLSVNPVNGRVYVSGAFNFRSVQIIDGPTGAIVKAVNAGEPYQSAVNKKTGKVFVVRAPNSVSVLNGTTDSFETSFTNTSQNQFGDNVGNVSVDEVTNTVYVLDQANGNGLIGYLTAFDANKGYAFLGQVDLGRYPTGIGLNTANRQIFVSNDSSGTVSVLQISAHAEAVVGQHFAYHIPTGFFDAGATVTYSATGLPQGFVLDSNKGVISGVAPAGSETTTPILITINATDGTNTVSTVLSLTISDGVPVFTVNGSGSPAANLADTVLAFAAKYPGALAGRVLNVQATTTPNDEASWKKLANGTNGYMTPDPSSGQYVYVVNSTSYPAVNGVYFRAKLSARGHPPDLASNVIGPFSLGSNATRAPQTVFKVIRNGLRADFDFRATEISAPAGTTVRVQSSTSPSSEGSWSNLTDANTGHMTQGADVNHFSLLINNYPAAGSVYFRAVASASGSVDSISNLIGPYTITADTPPVVSITSPGSGSGSDFDHPITIEVDSTGAATFKITANATSNRFIKSLSILFDGGTLSTVTGGATTASQDYTTTVIGDHVIEALAIDDLGATGRAGTGPVYIRVIPPLTAAVKAMSPSATSDAATALTGGKVFTVASSGGDWDDPTTWKDAQGNSGVPGKADFAIIGASTVTLQHARRIGSMSISGGRLASAIAANSFDLDVYGIVTISAASFDNVQLNISLGSVCELINGINIEFSGGFSALTNYGTLNVHGSGGILGEHFTNNGTLNWPAPLLQPSLLGYNLSPDGRSLVFANIQNLGRISASLIATGGGNVVSNDSAGVVSNDSASLIAQDGGTLVSNNGGKAISDNGAGLISQDGGTLISQDGGTLISQDGGTLIAQDGGTLVGNSGGTLKVTGNGTFAGSSNIHAATASSGFTQTGGQTDLNSIAIIGPVTINGGVLSGSGIIQGDLTVNGGYLAPGHSPGLIAVTGNYSQGADGTMIIEAAGGEANQSDQLQIGGSATLGGKLDVRTINGYVPLPNDPFVPIGYSSVSGSFASVSSNVGLTLTATGPVVTIDPTKPNPSTGQPLNIATRMSVQTDDNVLIAGFIVTGPSGSTKKVLIRGMGPSLAQIGVPGTLSDPFLELHQSDGTVTNDNWQEGDTSQIPDGFAPGDPRESVIVATLTPGNYSAIVKGAHGETGIGIAEVYDLDSASPAKLADISTRGFINTDDNVMIGGFIIGGNEPAKILVRAIGPTLTDFGVQGALADPTLELHDANGSTISNDDWRETQESEIIATTIPPNKDREPAILATLVPGNYTAIVRGKNNTTGIGLVEAYNLQ
jgi:hypothetical protein